jgi:hypothetical protein
MITIEDYTCISRFAIRGRINKVIHFELLFTRKKKTLVDLVNDKLSRTGFGDIVERQNKIS